MRVEAAFWDALDLTLDHEYPMPTQGAEEHVIERTEATLRQRQLEAESPQADVDMAAFLLAFRGPTAHKEAVDLLVEASTHRVLGAFANLGAHALGLHGVETAEKWWLHGAKLGCEKSGCNWALLKLRGEDCEDARTALAALRHLPRARFALGLVAFRDGDLVAAEREWRAAASGGHTPATVALAECIFDQADAIVAFEAAAKDGNAAAARMVGTMLLERAASEADEFRGEQWLRYAARTGEFAASSILFEWLAIQRDIDMVVWKCIARSSDYLPHYAESVTFDRILASADSPNQLWLWGLAAYAYGTERSVRLASQIWEQLIETGEERELSFIVFDAVEAPLCPAECVFAAHVALYNMCGRPEYVDSTERWALEASNQGSIRARCVLAAMLLESGEETDYHMAALMLELAVADEDTRAMTYLAQLLLVSGERKKERRGLRLLQLASEHETDPDPEAARMRATYHKERGQRQKSNQWAKKFVQLSEDMSFAASIQRMMFVEDGVAESPSWFKRRGLS